MSDGGKGSKPRPFSVPNEVFDNNWDLIFGKKDKKKEDGNNNRSEFSNDDKSTS